MRVSTILLKRLTGRRVRRSLGTASEESITRNRVVSHAHEIPTKSAFLDLEFESAVFRNFRFDNYTSK
jgi:hypothetical protein